MGHVQDMGGCHGRLANARKEPQVSGAGVHGVRVQEQPSYFLNKLWRNHLP